MSISRELVEGSAPNAASLKAARQLSGGGKLSALGREGSVAWGDVAGSGSSPYRVAFESEDVAFKCSCPSRKIPCKHALALALRFAEAPEQFGEGEKPSWVVEWQKNRAKRASKPEESGEGKAVDAAAQAKRAAAREEKVAGGLGELELWLRDVMRSGIAGLPSQPYGFWDKIAARMTDAQCPGLARRLRDMASVPHQNAGADWHEPLLRRLSGLHLIAEGYKRLGTLSPERTADIRALIGWNVDQGALLQSGSAVRDTWLSLSHTEEVGEDGVRSGQTWLWGRESNRPALVIQFGFGGAAVSAAAPVGQSFEGEMVFFPGSLPLRALVRERGQLRGAEFTPRGIGAPQVLEGWAGAVAAFPWLEAWPCVLERVVPARVGEALWLVGDAGSLPARTLRVDEWALFAASGGRPVDVFGVWDGRVLEPLAVLQGGEDRGARVSALSFH